MSTRLERPPERVWRPVPLPPPRPADPDGKEPHDYILDACQLILDVAEENRSIVREIRDLLREMRELLRSRG